jgi:anti-anti-sigma regulatory factor
VIDGATAWGAWPALAPPLRRHHRALLGSVAYQVLQGSALLDIDVRTSSDRLVIALSGELRDAMCGSFAEVLERALEGRQQAIVLDLRTLEAIDYSGVHAILLACLRANDDHREFLIEPGPAAVQLAFDDVNGPFRYT